MTKTCVITGGSSGIGLSIVKSFINDGYQVFNLDIQPSEYGHFIRCDMTDVSAVKNVVEKIGNEHSIDVLVSNAGVHFSANIEDTSEADFERVFNINVKGAFAATQACLPFMRAQQNGSIIYIASDQALIGKRNSFAYNLSKSALASMARTTALDYAAHNIRANAVCPGTIETPLYHNAINRYVESSGADIEQVHQEEAALQPLGRLGQPEEVAELTLFLASDKAKFITGSLQVIDGGYTAQ
ncbi:SDR family NAD(P)-dependent oxidoreductase [Thalassotalea euphylliae]|uniref:SDR family oxidoreductase n=1 Tax=Thalassotalea euphylliae TaxID=1655234 RepID=A0A3E0U297_9GAMM|nr:SDR family oxidoreductase [Thalassotalea euphylliae]REL30335.1 SDR family oxidoreductase [Thalassotalea euphylliae]